jgi:hypothetical protein
MEDLEYYKPIENSNPLAEDSFLEKILWQGLLWFTYTVFAALFILSLNS